MLNRSAPGGFYPVSRSLFVFTGRKGQVVGASITVTDAAITVVTCCNRNAPEIRSVVHNYSAIRCCSNIWTLNRKQDNLLVTLDRNGTPEQCAVPLAVVLAFCWNRECAGQALQQWSSLLLHLPGNPLPEIQLSAVVR